MNSVQQANERRQYYRINDVVGLTYSVIGSEKVSASSATDNIGIEVKELLAEIDAEFNQLSNTLWHETPTVAQALGLLNKKLSIIASYSLGGENQQLDCYEDIMVNISGSGIAFDCDEALETGTRLKLSLTLKPSNVPIRLTGEVTNCTANDAGKNNKAYRLSVAFEEQNESAMERIIQHVVQKQCAQRSAKPS